MAEINRSPEEEKKLKIIFNLVPKTLERPFIDHFPGYETIGMVRGEPGRYFTIAHYAKNADTLYNLKVRESDAWVVTYPKSGTTWVSELVWLLKNDLNYEVAAQKQLKERVLFPEASLLLSNEQVAEFTGKDVTMKTLDEIAQLPSPRCFNPHLTFDLLPANLLDVAKVVYVARNPKDVMVSYYHFHKASKYQSFTGTFEQFVHYFLNDEIAFTPYFHHVLTAWEKRFHPNMHFVFYEQLKMDLRGEIKRAASFFNKSLSDSELNVLEDHLDFKNFKNNESANWEYFKKSGSFEGDFMRKGIIGDWKNHFSPELNERVDEWIKENLHGTDLKFIVE